MDTEIDNTHATEPRINTLWLPILIGVLLFSLVLVFWWTLREEDLSNQHNMVMQYTEKLSANIQADIRSRVPALQRIVNRWEFSGGTPEASFINDAGHYINDWPGFQAIGWVDKTLHVKWIVPLAGNEKAVGIDLGFEKNRRTALEQAKNARTPTMSKSLDLVQGGKGFIIYFPIYIKQNFDGFLSVVFRIKPWLNHVFLTDDTPNDLSDFKICVDIDGTTVYSQKGWDMLQATPFDATTSTIVMGHKVTISCRPTQFFFDHHNNLHPAIALLVGSILTILISFIVHLFQKTSSEAWRTYSTQKTLKFEIQNHEKTTRNLQHASARLTLAAKAGKIGIWEWDVTTNTLTWNERMYELYDVPTDINPSYETWSSALHTEDAEEAEAKLKAAVEGKGTFDTEFRIITSDGGIKYIHAAAKAERDAKNNPLRMTGVNWDVTDQKNTEEQIRHMATHDVLTGLPTLKLAKDRVGMAFAIATRKELMTAVMFVDLDGFKNVNDTLGHDAGDMVLKETATRLLSCVRKVDTVARIGGDEFLIVLNELNSKNDMEQIAEKIVKSIAMPFVHEDKQVTVGASVGIAVCSASCAKNDVEKLIKQADEAMYSIKKTGKNGYAFAENDYTDKNF
ncbi:diguanylate cyclase (GGDEF) domain-containing protein [Maridesulfovibrio ferrireducens]|uniref:Diguanylate cyclase (GGDEF) domain-containing protein n=1 Tax=Maridesulfovibrio ferrireducens TaxID=246191 RepID=A0A1G9IXZ8_9BACT|nr:diguanylate cyclase [Maridesulfovibrio ferrireducens]SDL29961.1 diguanylate cyclase (GGDEF) domain-containing protein [Maridesulfovibrio ferrireducens]